jgi:chromosome segregation ATPase
MNRSAGAENLSPEEKVERAKAELKRLTETRDKYARRIPQLEKQVASAKEALVELDRQIVEAEKEAGL